MTFKPSTGASFIAPGRLAADVVVIGSGAGGATTACLLARSGLDVVVLEEGAHTPTEAFTGSVTDLMGRLYRGGGLTPIMGRPNIAWAEGRCLGGSTVINGAVMWRAPAPLLDRWAGELGLPDTDERAMDARFARLERDLGISTQSAPGTNRASLRLCEGADRMNWRAEATPRAQNGCRNSNRCPTGCPNGAKQSMLISYLPQAMADGARVICDARVHGLLRKGNRVEGVEATVSGPDGRRHVLRVEAGAVFVCGGPMQTPYFLLANGIKHNVGRNLRIHLNLKAVAVFDDDMDPAAGTIMTAQVKEFEDRGLFIGSSPFDPIYLALALAPNGRDAVEAVLSGWRRAAIYVAQVKATGPGRVRRSPVIGGPVPSYSLNAEDMENIRFAIHRTARVLFAAGAREIYFSVAGTGVMKNEAEARKLADGIRDPRVLDLVSVHGMASCPMGARESTSALGPYGRIRGLGNLFVNDASMLPGATGVNPQLTIMAMAMRNAEAFVEGRESEQ